MSDLKARLLKEGKRLRGDLEVLHPFDPATLEGVLGGDSKRPSRHRSLEALLKSVEDQIRRAYDLGRSDGIRIGSQFERHRRERMDGDIITFATEPFMDFEKIVVVGPQRSGTRFTAYAISHDLGYDFLDQTQIGLTNFGMMKTQLDKHERCVIQGTGCTCKIHELGREDVLVVWVRRNTADILASQKRIQWGESCERGRIPKPYQDSEPLCEGRYRYWTEVQKAQVPHWIEIDYESLRKHPLFIDRNTRWGQRGGKGFNWNQSTL